MIDRYFCALQYIGVARVAGAPAARITSNFAQFVGLRCCYYRHYASKHALEYAIFRRKKLIFWGGACSKNPGYAYGTVLYTKLQISVFLVSVSRGRPNFGFGFGAKCG